MKLTLTDEVMRKYEDQHNFAAGYEAGVADQYAEDQKDWIPIKWHEITDEEREREGYPEEWALHLDCLMPDDEQEILVQDRNGYISQDTCMLDDGYYLDSGSDWVEDIVAWRPMPEPYAGGAE